MARIVFQSYRLGSDDNHIRLSCLVGFGQRAITRLSIRGAAIGEAWQDSFGPLELGAAAELRGRQLLVTSTVYDANPDENDVYVEVRLDGGGVPLTIPITDKVPADWDSLNIVFILDFI